MEHNKHVCLIQPFTSYKLATIQPALFDQFDSIGLLALAAYLKEKGYTVEILHLAKAFRNGYSKQQVVDKIRSKKPLLFGIGNMWVHQSVGMLETAQLLGEIFEDVPIVVGGQHSSFFAKDIVEKYSHLINGVIVGEGEETIYEIVRMIEKNGMLISGIPGFMSKDNSGEINYMPREVTLDLDSLPFMTHKDVWPKVQRHKDDIIPLVGPLDTVRGGCPHQCGHCLEANPIGELGRRRRNFHSPDYILDQLKLYLQEGKTIMMIQDSFYANGDGPIIEFVEKALENNIMTDAMHFFIEPGYVSSDIFKVLEKFPAKKVAIDYGIETGSEKVANNMNRFRNFDKIYEDVEALGKTNTLATAWWLVSLPGETEEDIRLTEKAIMKTIDMGVFTERVSQMLLFPQTELYRNREQYDMTAYFHNFDDFKVFSTIERRENGIYPELVTHEMPYQTKEDTLRHLKRLKKSIRIATESSKHYDKMKKLGFQLNDFDFF